MNAMRKILEEFLENSSPEQLRAELSKGNRPFFQTLEDSVLGCENQSALPTSIPASVSFFNGTFAQEELCNKEWASVRAATMEVAANQELALAA